MRNTQKKNVPELRFPGFEGEWEEKKLGEVAEIVRGASPRPIKDSKWFSKESDIGWLRISDVTEQNGKIYHLDQKLSKEGQEKTRVLLSKHLLLSIAASIGKPVMNFVKTGVHDGFLIFLNPKFNIYFMYYWLEYFKDKWSKYGQPGSQVNLNSEIVKSQNIYLPIRNEQQKIGEFFSKLDRQIELEEQKLELLQQQKKGYMQKIFSQELRFKDENENDYPEWEEKKLGELSQIVRGASPRPIKDPKWFNKESDIGWLRISDVTDQNGKIYHLDQKLSKEGQEKTRVLLTTHLLLSIAASIGKPVMNFVKTGVHDGFLIFLNPKFNLFFMYYWLEYFKDKWSKYGQPGSQVNLNSEIVKSQTLNMPSNHEQEKVGQFFNRNEKLIELQQEKIMYLKRRKQVLLQKMFI
ncbi:TPA: restriction endonuclease subunit S [Staphylococcus aureus]|nr:restriction endonuclease subunit S [Staphylococcus aureus]